jgi:aminocarboxymuconate-semialdehyde decarboxylase
MLIDVHCHVAPLDLPGDPAPNAGLAWPCMQCKGTHAATLHIGNKPFRELDDRSWDVQRRCEDMDRDGVAIQVLSPMPELLSYWFPAEHAEYLADHVNAGIAEMIAKAPGRFRGLGMVPLQEPERAARYLTKIRDRFGLQGVEIGSNISGVLPGDAKFSGFFEAAEALNLAVFIHALHPLATRGVEISPEFTPLVGFPIDTAMAGASLILGGMMERYPRLRIGLSHGGGAMATLLGRLDQGWHSLPAFKARLVRSPSEQARTFFYDSNVYDQKLLQHLVRHMAPGHVFVGTDYPYAIMQIDPHAFIHGAELEAAEMTQLSSGAALEFLGLTGIT